MNIAESWNYYICETVIACKVAEKTIPEVEAYIVTCKQEEWVFLVACDDVCPWVFYIFLARDGVEYAKTMEHTVLTASRARGLGAGQALMDALCEHA